jgi:hypothetical protein
MTLPPLPRRVRSDVIRRTVDASPPAAEVRAAWRAVVPQVSEPIRVELQRIADRLARLVAEHPSAPS